MSDELGSVQSPDDWHPIASPVAPLLSSRLDDAVARSADWPSAAAAPISVFRLVGGSGPGVTDWQPGRPGRAGPAATSRVLFALIFIVEPDAR